MKARDFFSDFTRISTSPDRLNAAEVRFTVKGVEMRIEHVRVDVGSPLTWTVELGNDPETEGHVLTAEEAEAAFQPRTVEGDDR